MEDICARLNMTRQQRQERQVARIAAPVTIQHREEIAQTSAMPAVKREELFQTEEPESMEEEEESGSEDEYEVEKVIKHRGKGVSNA